MKYFCHSIENEGESTHKWANLSILKNKTLFSFMTLKIDQSPFIQEQGS